MQQSQQLHAPTAEEGNMEEIIKLRHALSYDPETGQFTWAEPTGRRVKAGESAGSLWPSGYVGISCGGKRYLAHRLAWLFTYGEWPTCDVDHINRNPADNRISNLRLATRSENNVNAGLRSTNSSGVRGVYWSKRSERWIARVQKGGRQVHVGSFKSLDQASAAVRDAYVREFGAFAS